jgi:hypothetical protein
MKARLAWKAAGGTSNAATTQGEEQHWQLPPPPTRMVMPTTTVATRLQLQWCLIIVLDVASLIIGKLAILVDVLHPWNSMGMEQGSGNDGSLLRRQHNQP